MSLIDASASVGGVEGSSGKPAGVSNGYTGQEVGLSAEALAAEANALHRSLAAIAEKRGNLAVVNQAVKLNRDEYAGDPDLHVLWLRKQLARAIEDNPDEGAA